MKDLCQETLWPHEVVTTKINENFWIITLVVFFLMFIIFLMIYLGFVFTVLEI